MAERAEISLDNLFFFFPFLETPNGREAYLTDLGDISQARMKCQRIKIFFEPLEGDKAKKCYLLAKSLLRWISGIESDIVYCRKIMGKYKVLTDVFAMEVEHSMGVLLFSTKQVDDYEELIENFESSFSSERSRLSKLECIVKDYLEENLLDEHLLD